MQQKRRGVSVVLSMGLVYFLGGSGGWMESGRAQGKSNHQGVIRGTVRDQQNPLYGILVKAKAEGKNYSTSVFTDEQGEYVFPPLPAGSYVVSVGTKWQEKVDLASSPAKKDFVVELGSGFMNQTSGSSWFAIIPGTEAEKKTLSTYCSGCHSVWRLVDRPQSSPQAWVNLIRRMAANDGPLPSQLAMGQLGEENYPVLAKYLSNAITGLKERHVVEAMIRPRGEGAKAVFTEWDLPKGIASPTGVKTDSKGMIWFSAGSIGALGRLDPRSGEFQNWPAPIGKEHVESPLHDVVFDKDENIWVTASGFNKIIKFDTKTFQYASWDIPAEYGKYPLVGDIAADGNFWAAMRDVPVRGGKGFVVKLDPRTGKFTGYPTKNIEPFNLGPFNYGLAVDSKGTVWFTENYGSKLGKISPQTGEVTEYSTPIPNAGPRRIQVDSKGNLWFTESFADKIGKFEPTTMKFTNYDSEARGGHPYFVRIDKSDHVWFNQKNNNTIGKLDPKTGKITHTLFPMPDTSVRDPGFDSTDPFALVYGGTGIGRVYFRR